MNKLIVLYCLFTNLFLSSCLQKDPVVTGQASRPDNWQTVLQEKLPLLGHRNWIVITDMAYPLQAKEGITTLYASEPYTEVLGTVKNMLDNSMHVYAHTYQDKELSFLEEDFCPGIAGLKAEMKQVLSSSEIINIEHDQLIARLDSISNLFEVVIIKTGLTKPYTSTFFELDCKYWDNSKQSILNGRIADAKQSK
ncbi:RbsD/FucU domain-containing protein [uncultured Parabacteroides sp.]|uniref:RbsD/FucU domain-containing protein n=1 Tax=uncultured Parabacteroides sp. TaxID=512312 RepID=UPI00259B0162|nr:RbsD/FucU domain-containing protein [uncultured Parabacteroides sp.]